MHNCSDMEKLLNVIPECYVDTHLTCVLLGVNGVNHNKGCNQVCSTMKKKFNDKFAIGIIDDDKRKHTYVNEFKEIASSRHIVLLKHPSKSHYLILIRHAVEDFILSCVEELKIDMSKYGLPSDMEGLKIVTKNEQSSHDPRFNKLFRDLCKASELTALSKVLVYLNDKKYNSDVETLKGYFSNI